MGRRRDPPEVQEAKGSPRQRGRRRKKGLEAQAAAAAEVLAAAPPAERDDPTSPPAFMDDRFPEALKVWRMYAPELRKTHRLQARHRPTFALFCVYYGEWLKATEDIATNGYQQEVATIAGGTMWRMRPSVVIRERAFANVVELSKLFGLTPRDEYALFRDQRVAAMSAPSLFDEDEMGAPVPRKPDGEGEPTSAEPAAKPSSIGALAGMDSPPPGSRPN